jgi:O-antigen/teichoic acid export membrane protein
LEHEEVDGRKLIAQGAGLAFLGRLGALMEVINQPVFTRLFGLATYGLYIVLLSYVKLITAVTELAMTSALQRYGAGAKDEETAHAVVKFALLTTTALSIFAALILTLIAPFITPIFNVANADAEMLPATIALYAWSLPVWTLTEIATSAVRARRAFGPEIRIRIFYEQFSRLVFAVGFFFAGWGGIGLFAAHVASLLLAAVLSLRLMLKHYDFKLLLHTPVKRATDLGVIGFSALIVPTHIIQRGFSELPPILLNAFLPGAIGAEAAGLYGIARKIASVLHIIRLSFDYVLAPLAAVHARVNWAEVKTMYAYSTRLATMLVLPLAGALIITRHDVVALFGTEAAAAAPIIVILTLGRSIETMTGPAAALVEVLGQRVLPLINNLSGMAVLFALGAVLTPKYGPMGMAIATAIAVNVTALAAMVQLIVIDKIHPFSDGYFRSLLWGGAGSILLLSFEFLPTLPRYTLLLGGLSLLIGIYFVLLRFGLKGSDRVAFRRSKSIDQKLPKVTNLP